MVAPWIVDKLFTVFGFNKHLMVTNGMAIAWDYCNAIRPLLQATRIFSTLGFHKFQISQISNLQLYSQSSQFKLILEITNPMKTTNPTILLEMKRYQTAV